MNSSQIQYFETRDINYYQSLIKTFDLQSLKDSAIEVLKDGKVTKMIRIDYCGSSAATFFQQFPEKGEQYDLFKAVETLFINLQSIEKEYSFRIRLLFIYPYSHFAFDKIEAEQSHFRPTIEEPKIKPETVKLFSHSLDDFMGSEFYTKQRESLFRIQDLFNTYCKDIAERELLKIRFSCIPPNVRAISINNTVFTEPYLYARQNKHTRSLNKVSIVRIDRTATSLVKVFEDHFRYIWTHPTTLFYEDATNFIKNSGGYMHDLPEFKEPRSVTFDKKTNTYKNIFKEKVDDVTINTWKFQAERSFFRGTRSLESTPLTETLFVAFSFENGKKMADSLRDFIIEDFPKGLLRVNIVDLDFANSNLYSELIQKMQEATMALILFTKDIIQSKKASPIYYSKPNISFEFGYLLAHIKQYGKAYQRITVFADEDLSIGSDIQDIGRFKLSSNEIVNYKVIVERIIRAHTGIHPGNGEIIIKNCLERIQQFHDSNKLTDELKGKLIVDYKNEFRVRITRILEERFK